MQNQKTACPPPCPPACGGGQGGGNDVFATEDHDTAACGAVAVMPSHPTVRCQRQRLNFIHRGPRVPQFRQKKPVFQQLIFQRRICRTAVPTGEAHRLPQKVRVFIGATAQSQGRLPQNCNTRGHFAAVVATSDRQMGRQSPCCKPYYGRQAAQTNKCVRSFKPTT